jgi:hypothetical protein
MDRINGDTADNILREDCYRCGSDWDIEGSFHRQLRKAQLARTPYNRIYTRIPRIPALKVRQVKSNSKIPLGPGRQLSW